MPKAKLQKEAELPSESEESESGSDDNNETEATSPRETPKKSKPKITKKHLVLEHKESEDSSDKALTIPTNPRARKYPRLSISEQQKI